MEKDWVGGKASVFKTLGASNHTDHERQREDYYATEPAATEWLCKLETFCHDVWEPACGEGHISEVLIANGYRVRSSDIVDRGYGEMSDFLFGIDTQWNGDIITNPPYKYAKEFVERALMLIPEGHKVAMFLKLTFLEGKARKELFKITPPRSRMGIILSSEMRTKRRLQRNRWQCSRLRLVRMAERLQGRPRYQVV